MPEDILIKDAKDQWPAVAKMVSAIEDEFPNLELTTSDLRQHSVVLKTSIQLTEYDVIEIEIGTLKEGFGIFVKPLNPKSYGYEHHYQGRSAKQCTKHLRKILKQRKTLYETTVNNIAQIL